MVQTKGRKISPARRAAYRILLDLERGSGDLPRALAESREALRDPRDQSLAAQIALGTLRWRAEIDHVIAHFARRPVDTFDPEVLTVLRSGAYQLIHLSRVPASAAVNDAVDLVREVRKKSATGLVNAVLRAIAASGGNLPLPARPADKDGRDALVFYLSTALSHPAWLVSRWLARYGADATEEWLRFNNQEAPLTLRANGLKTTREELKTRLASLGVSTEITRFAPDGLVVTAGNPLRTPSPDDEFLLVVQDEASQLVSLMLPVKAGDTVLDACASPGGKTTQIAAAMNDRGLLVASDVRQGRVELLRQTIERSGARSVRLTQADFASGAPFKPVFDAVLLDAPCSGVGTLRRDPDIKWRRREEDVGALASVELRMLMRAADAVRPGGALVYATCSSEPEENENVVDAFLEARPEFSHVKDDRPTAALQAVLDLQGNLRTYPHVHGLEAFFAALLVRRPNSPLSAQL